MKRVVCTKLDESVIEVIDRIARSVGTTRAEILRQLIIEALALRLERS